MITQSGEELKLFGGLKVFNCYVNSEYLGNRKAVKVLNHFYHSSKKRPNPLKRLAVVFRSVVKSLGKLEAFYKSSERRVWE